MATLPAFPVFSSLSTSTTNLSSSLLALSPALPFRPLRFHVHGFLSSFRLSTVNPEKPRRLTSVKAEGKMSESSIPTVANALQSFSSAKSSDLHGQEVIWEDPDDGNGSEYDEEDEEENDLDFESDWEEERDSPLTSTVEQLTVNNYEVDLVKEVEQLLEPAELEILRQNANPNLETLSTVKWNLLHTFALSGQITFMDKLLQNGFSIDSVDQDGRTALHKAIIGKKETIIGHLLRKGASPHVKDYNGATPLHYAVQVSAKQTVKLLIKYKVDVNDADKDGWTPLHIAIQSRNRDIAKILLVNGADRNRRTKEGKTALDMSLCYGKNFKSYDLAKLLKVVPIYQTI